MGVSIVNKVLFSHKSDDWATPKFLYWSYVVRCGYFDPCPLNCDHDSLLEDWSAHKNIFINPPYSNISAFVDKAIETYMARRGDCHIVFLLPVRTDSRWFRRCMDFGCDIQFIDFRLKFGDAKYSASFPFMLLSLDTICSSMEGRHTCRADITDLSFTKELYEDFLRKGGVF